jgi:hypothetical protein
LADITEALNQDAIADSLVDPAGAEPMPGGWGGHVTMHEVAELTEDGYDENLSSAENEVGDFLTGEDGRQPKDVHDSAASAEELDRVFGNPNWREAAAKPDQATAPQPEPTLAEIQTGMQQLGEAVEQLGLNDQGAATELAYSLTQPFGADPSSVDTKLLGTTMSKVVLSAAQIHAAGGTVGPVSSEAAKAFTSEFLGAFGIDARTAQVDSQRLANTVLASARNFIEATKTHGLTASLNRLNEGEAAEFYVNNLLQSFGINQPADRAHALQIADAFGKYMLGVLGKLPQAAQRQAQQRTQAARNSRPGKKSSKVQMRTNTDLFDADTMAFYHQQHGRY